MRTAFRAVALTMLFAGAMAQSELGLMARSWKLDCTVLLHCTARLSVCLLVVYTSSRGVVVKI